MTEISKVDATAAICMSVNNSLMRRFENIAVKSKMKYLVPLAKESDRCFVCQSQKQDLMQHLKKQHIDKGIIC
jgi:hypothetical protein